jgi:hypothetical protein
MTKRPQQPNLFLALKRALDESPTLNPNQQGGEYQYWLDIGVILRCLVEDHTDEEILASLGSHGYKASAFGAAVRFLRQTADSMAS